MKLVTFRTREGREHIGAVLADGASVADFTAASNAPWFRSMLDLIDGGESALAEAKSLAAKGASAVKLADVKLLAPVPEPRQMRDFLAFEKHVRQARANRYLFGLAPARVDPEKIDLPPTWAKFPVYYKCNRFSVNGPESDVLWPRYAKMLDYELEFGVFIGKNGKNIPKEEARSYIFGYCIFNDVSARDTQMAEMQGQLGPAKGKDFDTGNVLGPWLVTADEIPDPYNLTMIARVNGEEWSRGNSKDMFYKFEDMIAWVTYDEKLRAGEFLGSGTVGSGCGLELGKFLKPGDVMELEVQGLGVLRNRIIAQ